MRSGRELVEGARWKKGRGGGVGGEREEEGGGGGGGGRRGGGRGGGRKEEEGGVEEKLGKMTTRGKVISSVYPMTVKSLGRRI